MNKPLCDLCERPFTDAEYANRITPHEIGCPNYFAHLSDTHITVDCDCDRDYHGTCWIGIEDDDDTKAAEIDAYTKYLERTVAQLAAVIENTALDWKAARERGEA